MIRASCKPSEPFACALSVDLESWVHRQVGCALDANSKKDLDQGYIEKATLCVLNLLDRHNRKVTFFVVSEIFDWYPDLIEEIKEHGHEIAYHTHTHRLMVTAQDLVEELRRSESFLGKFQPVGFRAPEGRIGAEHMRILADYGFEYDSSSYGVLNTSKIIHGIREIPISTYGFFNSSSSLNLPRNITKRLLCRELPLGSGFFMSAMGPAARILPYMLSFQNEVPVLFVHPWQIITHQDVIFASRNGVLRQTALSLYSRGCLGAFTYVLSHFHTIPLKNLAREFPRG